MFAALGHIHIKKVAAAMPKKSTDNIFAPNLDEAIEAMNEASPLSPLVDPKDRTLYNVFNWGRRIAFVSNIMAIGYWQGWWYAT